VIGLGFSSDTELARSLVEGAAAVLVGDQMGEFVDARTGCRQILDAFAQLDDRAQTTLF